MKKDHNAATYQTIDNQSTGNAAWSGANYKSNSGEVYIQAIGGNFSGSDYSDHGLIGQQNLSTLAIYSTTDIRFRTGGTAAANEKLRITSDYLIKRPAYGGSGLYSKIKLVSGGSSNITHNIFREFKDSVNWTSGGVLVKVLSRSYNTPNFDYAEFLCRYGAYGGSTTAVDVKVAPHSSSNIPTPAYSSQSTLSGNTVYRDVSIVTGYYRVLVIEIVTSMGQVYTSTAGGNGTIYYH